MSAESPKPVAPSLPGANSALALLLIINLFNYIDRYVLAAVEPEIRETFFSHLDDDAAKARSGFLATAFLLTYMIISPIFGYLADRRSRWKIIALGVFIWSLASGASGLASVLVTSGVALSVAFVFLLVTRCLVGFGEAAYGPAAPSIISDLYPVQKRGQVLAVFYLAIPVGAALGFVLGALIKGAIGWPWAFYVVMPPGLVLAGLCWFRRDPPRGNVDAVTSKAPTRLSWKDLKVLARTPSYVLDTAGMTAMTFAIGGIVYWVADYTEKYRGFTHWMGVPSGMVFGGITVVAGLTATLSGGYLGDKLRPRFSGSYFLVSGIAMLLAAPFIMLFVATPFPWAYLPLFLAVFCLFFNTGPTNTILANVTHPSIRASAFALNIFVIHALGDAISPPLLGWIIGKDRYVLGFGVVAVMVLVGGLLWLWGTRYLKEDTEMAPRRAPILFYS